MQLSKKSIQETIAKVREIKNRTDENMKLATVSLMEATFESLVNVFKDNNLSNHINSLQKEINNNGYGFRIWTDDWIIIFNEYGTGIKGEGTHPNPSGYSYNIKTEYKDEFGRWVYYNDKTDSFITTSGMPAKHMFYDVEQLLKENAKEFYSTAVKLAINNEQYQTFRSSLRG